MRSRPVSLLLQRCPRCRMGRPFEGLLRMRTACPICGLVFEREPGYWLGSLYANYAIAIVVVVPLLAVMVAAGASTRYIVTAAIIELAILTPVIIRYARLVWMYIDQAMDPR